MGRALYSEKYGVNAVAVRVQLQPDSQQQQAPERWTKWSLSNRFDPDSDEFFEDAEYEAFMDQEPLDLPLPEPLPTSDSSGSSSSSSSSEDSDSASGRDSPIPVRMSAIWDQLLDEEAAAAEYTAVPEEQLLLDIPGYRDARVGPGERVPVHSDDGPPRAVAVSVHPHPHQPSALRNSTTATDLALRAGSDPIAIPLRAATPPTTHDPDFAPASASPTLSVSPFSAFSASPSTPPALHARFELSPPPTVTPRIYMWGSGAGAAARAHPYLASPASPTRVRHTHPSVAPALRRVNEPIA